MSATDGNDASSASRPTTGRTGGTAPVARTGLRPEDDRRHRPEPGGRMRDSLFFQTVLAEEQVALQVYLFVTGTGAAGYNVVVWGGPGVPLVRQFDGGRVPEDMDFDDFSVGSLTVRNREPLRTATVSVRSEHLDLDLSFAAIQDAFSYHDNPDGLPSWFALDRIEQTGRVEGALRAGDRSYELGPMGHRDHSWGMRDWRAPQHWKWFVAYTPSGVAVNGWIWVARGAWGFAGSVLRDGVTIPVRTIEHTATYDDRFQQQTLRAVLHDVEGGSTSLELDVFGVVHLGDERTGTTILEGACTARIDGEDGVGQFETEWPTPYFEHLRGDDGQHTDARGVDASGERGPGTTA